MRKTQHPERVVCAVPVAIRNKKTSWKVVFYGGVDIHYVLIKFRISWWVVQKKGVPPRRGHCIFLAKDKGSWVVFLFVFFSVYFYFILFFAKVGFQLSLRMHRTPLTLNSTLFTPVSVRGGMLVPAWTSPHRDHLCSGPSPSSPFLISFFAPRGMLYFILKGFETAAIYTT